MRKTNKKSIVAGALALAMVLTGTGYAAWTNTLKIKARATTGEFEVRFADLGLYAQYGDENYGWSIVDGIGDGYVAADFFLRGTSDYNAIAKKGSVDAYYERSKKYNNVEFNAELTGAKPIDKTVGPYTTANTNGSDLITLDIQNMYPGYAQAFRTDILNLGTLAAKLSNIKFDANVYNDKTSTSEEVEKMLGVALFIHTEGLKGEKDEDVFTLVKSLGVNKDDIFTVGGVDFLRLSALKTLDTAKIKEALKNNVIFTSPTTQHRMDLVIGVGMDLDLEGKYTTGTSENINVKSDDEKTQERTATIDITFNWDQFNVGASEAKPNMLEKQNMGEKKGK